MFPTEHSPLSPLGGDPSEAVCFFPLAPRHIGPSCRWEPIPGNRHFQPSQLLPPTPSWGRVTAQGITSYSPAASAGLSPLRRTTGPVRLEKTSEIPSPTPAHPTAHIPKCPIPVLTQHPQGWGLPPALGSCAVLTALWSTAWFPSPP